MESVLFRRWKRALRRQLPGSVQETRGEDQSIRSIMYTDDRDGTLPTVRMGPAQRVQNENQLRNFAGRWLAVFHTFRQRTEEWFQARQLGEVRYQFVIRGQYANTAEGEEHEWDTEFTSPYVSADAFIFWIVDMFGPMWQFDYIQFRMASASIRAFTAGGVGLGKDWAESHEDYYIVSFASTKNCLLNAILFAYRVHADPNTWFRKSLEECKEFVHQAAYDMKRRHLRKEDPDASWEGLLEMHQVPTVLKHAWRGAVAMPRTCELKIFDNLFHCKHRVTHKVAGTIPLSKPIEIMVQGNHILSMIPKTLVEGLEEQEAIEGRWEAHSMESMDSVGAVRALVQSKTDITKGMLDDMLGRPFDHPRTRRKQLLRRGQLDEMETKQLQKINAMLEKPRTLGAWDIETYAKSKGDGFFPYAIMFYGVTLHGTVFEWMRILETPEENLMNDFLVAAHEMMVEHHIDDLTLYAHNGAKFDLLSFLDKAAFIDAENPWKIDFQVEQHGAFTSLSLRSIVYAKKTLTFRDSMKLFGPCSLADLTKSFKVEHQKLKDVYSHEEVNWTFIQDNKPLITKYLYNDVVGLFEVMQKCRDNIQESFQVDVVSCMTASSLSKTIFFEWFYDPEKQRLFELPSDVEAIIRKSYFGGRTEVGWQCEVEAPIYMFDVTSLYPWAALNDLPCGRPERLGKEDVTSMMQNRSFFGFVVVRVRSIPSDEYFRPVHGCRARDRLVFPLFEEWTEVVLFSGEIYYAQDKGNHYEYDYQFGFHFTPYPILKDFMLTMTRRKAEAEAKKDNVGRTMSKLLANTGYGWPAVRVDNKNCIHIYDKGKNMVAHHFVRNELISWADRGSYQVIKTRENLPLRNYNVALSAAITSIARMRIHDIITSIEAIPDMKVFYWDTDSVATNCDIAKFPDLMKKFAWDGMQDFSKMGLELGSLKNEAMGIYKDHQIPVTEQPFFDRGIFLLPKLYLLEKNLPDGRVYSKGASKGISRRKPIVLREDKTLWDDGQLIGRVENGRAVDVEGNPMVVNGSVCNENNHICNLQGTVLLDNIGRPMSKGAPNYAEMASLLQGEKLMRANTSFTRPLSTLLQAGTPSHLLQHSIMQRSISVCDTDGNRYMKGIVDPETGFIRSLQLPKDDPVTAQHLDITMHYDVDSLTEDQLHTLSFDELLEVGRASAPMEGSRFSKWYEAMSKAVDLDRWIAYNEEMAQKNLEEDQDASSDEDMPDVMLEEPGLHHALQTYESDLDSEDLARSEDEEEDEPPKKRSRFLDDCASEASDHEP